MLTIPDDAAPADVVGETDILAGQDWLNKNKLIHFANWMLRGDFPWEQMQSEEPVTIEVGSNGRVLSQGHHRWLGARLAGVQMPVTIEISRSYWPGPVPFAVDWKDVLWEVDPDEPIIPFRR